MNVNEVIEMVSGHLAVEGKISGADLLTMMGNEGVKPATVARVVREMEKAGAVKFEGTGLALTTNDIVFVKEYEAPAPVEVAEASNSPETGNEVSKKYPYGYDIQTSYYTGKPYKLARSEFDGPKIQLSEEYELKKKDLQDFNEDLKNMFDEFIGAGPQSIAILNTDPNLERFENKNGYLFHRWNAENVKKVIDKYHPFALQLKEKAKQAKEEMD